MPVTRSTIDEIKIQNFKFFPKLEQSIKVDGKHLLLYGENGSGKSSIYWALYTLLECANKDDIKEIKKYFDYTDEERLINVHLKHGTANWVDPFVEVTLKDGTAPYRISYTDTAINTNTEAQESNLSSDFINYRNLLSLYNFAHSEDVDLTGFFNYAVFPYVKFTDVKIGTKSVGGVTEDVFEKNANKLFRLVNDGPKKDKKTIQGKDRFPIQKEKEFADFYNIVEGFRSGLDDLLTYIKTEGNEFLKRDLGFNFGFDLELDWERHLKPSKRTLNPNNDLITIKRFPNTVIQKKDFSKYPFLLTEQFYLRPQFKIWLSITDYENEKDVVRKPHSFLNEARLTALGLAIRLAVLKRSLSEDAKLKILALDDLLISLDMSNRQKILNLLLGKYHEQYQLLILTHDRSFYEVTKSKIKNLGFEKNWLFYEMYVDESKLYKDNTPSPIKPIIFSTTAKLTKAEDFIARHDYPAAGIYLRNSCEEQLDDLYPDFLKFETKKNKDGNLETVSLTLNDKILKLKEFCLKENVVYEPFKDLKIYKDCFLNVIAHNDKTEPLYKVELVAVLNALKQLSKIKRSRHIIKSTKDVMFDLADGKGNTFHCIAKIKGNLIILEEEGKIPVLSNYNQCEIRKTVTNGAENLEPFNINSIVEFYKSKCAELKIEPNHDLFQLFRYRGSPIQQKLDELLNPPA